MVLIVKQSVLVFAVLLVAVGFCPLRSAYPIFAESNKAKQSHAEFAPKRLIVKLRSQVDKGIILRKTQGTMVMGLPQLDHLNSKFNVKKGEKLFRQFEKTALKSDRLSGVYVFEAPPGTDVRQMKAEYEESPEVEYAEPDYEVELFETPNDPLYPHQWSLNNIGAAQNGGSGYYGIDREADHILVMKFGQYDADIDALEAFERNDEKTLPLIGIIDTGVDLDHEDLQENIWTNPGEIPGNGIDDDHNGFVDDVHGWDFSGDSAVVKEDNDPTDTYGHGTHCAGIIGAVRNNGIGISGINTPCKIMAIKFFPNSYISLGAKGIVYAADMGCDIINLSWGSPYPSKLLTDALDYAVDRGVLPVAAAGNDGMEQYNYPAADEKVIAVGASDSKDQITDFSTYGRQIAVVAPGRDILSLRADQTDMYAEDGFPNSHIIQNSYYLADGTSMASPCVAGVAAYILAASPGTSAQTVREIIEQSADDIIYPFGGDSLYSPGKDIYSGYGRVNLNSALQLISGRLAKIDYPYENALVSGNVAILGTASGDSFQDYVLEYGRGFSPVSWTQIETSITRVKKDTLAVWDTRDLTGLFTLRLTVGNQNQAVIHVIVDNGTHVEITSPRQDDTISGYSEIRGFTIVPSFSHYTLEYASAESPVHWYRITTSTKMVAERLLGSWVVSFLPEGDYFIHLSVETNAGETYADTVRIMVKGISASGWVQELSACGCLCPAVGDIDGDGYKEIVVGMGGSAGSGMTGGISVYRCQGTLEPGWPKDTDKNMMSSPALGDLDGDGIPDIVICCEQGVHAYLSGQANWFRSADTGGNRFWSLATPVIADLENDGQPEVLTMSGEGIIYAWRSDGRAVMDNGAFAQTVNSYSDMGFPCLAVADLDGDGKNEVIAGAAHPVSGTPGHYEGVGGVYIWDKDGKVLLQPGDYPIQFAQVFGIAVADIDQSGDLEVVVFGMDQERYLVCAFKKDGTEPPGYPIVLSELTAGLWFGNHPALGDLDGDGSMEIVVSLWTIGEARIYAWHQDGRPLVPRQPFVTTRSPDSEKEREAFGSLGMSIGELAERLRNGEKTGPGGTFSDFEDSAFASEAETFGSPVLADINGDGSVDIIVRAGYFLASGFERVFAWDSKGDLLPGFPLHASATENMATYFPYTPTLADIDQDGKLDMVLVTDCGSDAQPKLICWEFGANCSAATMPWPKYMHDTWNSGRHGFEPPGADYAEQPPFNFHLKGWSDTSIMLAWTPKAPWVSLGYNIYRGTASGQHDEKINHELIAQPDSQYEDFDVTSGGSYFYTVTSVDTNHRESDQSKEVGVTPGRPSAPSQLQARMEHGVVTLSWAPNPGEEEVQAYRIYHQSPNSSTSQLMDGVTSETTYVDSSLKWAGVHYYRITAVNSRGQESPPSWPVLVYVQSQGSPPGDLKVSDWLGTSLTLSWTVEPKADSCHVFRSTIPGVYRDHPPEKVAAGDPPGPSLSYRDSGLVEGTVYYYAVTQIRGITESSPSDEVEFLAGRPHAPTDLSGEVQNCHIVLHWRSSDEQDVTRYRIYDRFSSGNDYSLRDSVQDDTVYTDPSVDDSLEHYFLMTALDSSGLESFLPSLPSTSPVHLYGPLFPPDPPSEFKISSHTDTSITFWLFRAGAQAYNIYVRTADGAYGKTPINSTPIPYASPCQYVYQTSGLSEGKDYLFSATCIRKNECGTVESRMDTSLEAVFLFGRPEPVVGLSVELDNHCHVVVRWRPSPEGDVVRYRIYHRVLSHDFQVKDSVFAPQTIYIDSTLSDSLPHCYTVTAVDSLGLESQSVSSWACVSASRPSPPWGVSTTGWTDTSATLRLYLYPDQDVIGCNLYRSLVSGDFEGLRPINDTLLTVDSLWCSSYTDRDVKKRTTYFYTATTVNKCGLESALDLGNHREDSVTVGRPHEPLLEVRSGKQSIKLCMSSSEADIEGYKIFRQESNEAFQVICPLHSDSVYTDTDLAVGVDYHYRVTVIDSSNLQGSPSSEIEGCLMPLDSGMVLVDLTRGSDVSYGCNGDSVDSFYRRALEGYDHAWVHPDPRTPLSLLRLSFHPVAILYSEDELSTSGLYSPTYPVLKQYLQAGGALLIEGRKSLFSPESPSVCEYWHFESGDFRHDFLNIDSAYIPRNWDAGNKTEEFVGARRNPMMKSYPEIVEMDTLRVNHAYDPDKYELGGRLPGVGYFIPVDSSEVMYTFVSAYDTSASSGRPVALRHITEDYAVIYFDFPLSFVKENIAIQILHQALTDLKEFAHLQPETVATTEDLAGASVFPNPFKPYQGHTNMTFDGLTSNVKIEIFTLTGEKVCTLQETDGDGKLSWDVTNSQGKKLASGVYIYRITNNLGQEKIAKLAVIR
ncbi:MAG: S8 family serine peptidase [Candidatus Zixiibacteriota bacterium]